MTGAECQTGRPFVRPRTNAAVRDSVRPELVEGPPPHPPHPPDTAPYPAPIPRRYPPPMQDLLSRPTTSLCAPIGASPYACRVPYLGTRATATAFIPKQVRPSFSNLVPAFFVLGNESNSYGCTIPESITISYAERGKQPDPGCALTCRNEGEGSLRPTAPYARSTSVAPPTCGPRSATTG